MLPCEHTHLGRAGSDAGKGWLRGLGDYVQKNDLFLTEALIKLNRSLQRADLFNASTQKKYINVQAQKLRSGHIRGMLSGSGTVESIIT